MAKRCRFQSTHSRGVRRPKAGGLSNCLTDFNPRTHEECDCRPVNADISDDISIHALTRSATADGVVLSPSRPFQSTHSRGVRLMGTVSKMQMNKFQSTHSRGVRPQQMTSITGDLGFQSTHSRGVRHANQHELQQPDWISIHALTRSATFMTTSEKAKMLDFNPRTHEECDYMQKTCSKCNVISIHALTRSATTGSIHSR